MPANNDENTIFYLLYTFAHLVFDTFDMIGITKCSQWKFNHIICTQINKRWKNSAKFARVFVMSYQQIFVQ